MEEGNFLSGRLMGLAMGTERVSAEKAETRRWCLVQSHKSKKMYWAPLTSIEKVSPCAVPPITPTDEEVRDAFSSAANNRSPSSVHSSFSHQRKAMREAISLGTPACAASSSALVPLGSGGASNQRGSGRRSSNPSSSGDRRGGGVAATGAAATGDGSGPGVDTCASINLNSPPVGDSPRIAPFNEQADFEAFWAKKGKGWSWLARQCDTEKVGRLWTWSITHKSESMKGKLLPSKRTLGLDPDGERLYSCQLLFQSSRRTQPAMNAKERCAVQAVMAALKKACDSKAAGGAAGKPSAGGGDSSSSGSGSGSDSDSDIESTAGKRTSRRRTGNDRKGAGRNRKGGQSGRSGSDGDRLGVAAQEAIAKAAGVAAAAAVKALSEGMAQAAERGATVGSDKNAEAVSTAAKGAVKEAASAAATAASKAAATSAAKAAGEAAAAAAAKAVNEAMAMMRRAAGDTATPTPSPIPCYIRRCYRCYIAPLLPLLYSPLLPLLYSTHTHTHLPIFTPISTPHLHTFLFTPSSSFTPYLHILHQGLIAT